MSGEQTMRNEGFLDFYFTFQTCSALTGPHAKDILNPVA